MNERITKLKERLPMVDDHAIFFERVTLLEEAYQIFKDDPPGRRYAAAFDYLLSNISVQIRDEELIVGFVKEITPNKEQEQFFYEKADKNDFRPLELFSIDPLQLIKITDVGKRYAPSWFNSYGHLTVSWETLLDKGFEGISRDAKNELKLVASEEEKTFLENVIMTCKSMIEFGKRYSEEAKYLAGKVNNLRRQNELEMISKICNNVPAKPVSNFWEALQSIWFTYMVLHCICGARDYALGRFDKYLYRFYQRDIKKGILTRSKALELLECFFIKLNEIIGRGVEFYSPKRVLQVNSLQYLIIGGINEKGEDVSNELSSLVLDAINELKLKQPTVIVRYHKNINKDVFRKACEIAKKGLGYPTFFNDSVVVQALKNLGVNNNDALNYVYYGCNNINIPGKEDELREAWHNLPKYLELVLNEGNCLLSGKRIGIKTKSLEEIKSFDDLLEELRSQIRNGIKLAVNEIEANDEIWEKIKPFSFESVLLKECIKKRKDCTSNGVMLKHMNNNAVGIATLSNSLASIKKLVFEDKRFKLGEIREILKSNFKGYERLREEIIHKIPKFGNDNPYVDEIAQTVGNIFCEEVKRVSASAKRELWPSFYSLWHHREMGKYTAASADGRLLGEPISENQSPVYGTEQCGPTAVLNSVSKLPFDLAPGGGLNLKLQPSTVKGEKGTSLVASLIEGYFSKGGLQIQLNVIDKNTLLDAKRDPEKYQNLLVRVVGYSAYFVTLSPEQQDEIIARTEL